MGTNGYANPSALVETEWLQAHLDDPSVRVVEVDEDVTAYATGHIPGAVGWNWTADLRAVVGRDFIDQETLGGLLRSAGVNADTTVVLYAGNNNWFAAYAYWLLRYLGFDAVKLLNGGRKKGAGIAAAHRRDPLLCRRHGFALRHGAQRDPRVPQPGPGPARPRRVRGRPLARGIPG